jgi:hypothetical protein
VKTRQLICHCPSFNMNVTWNRLGSGTHTKHMHVNICRYVWVIQGLYKCHLDPQLTKGNWLCVLNVLCGNRQVLMTGSSKRTLIERAVCPLAYAYFYILITLDRNRFGWNHIPWCITYRGSNKKGEYRYRTMQHLAHCLRNAGTYCTDYCNKRPTFHISTYIVYNYIS